MTRKANTVSFANPPFFWDNLYMHCCDRHAKKIIFFHGTWIWFEKCPDDLFGKICIRKGYKSKHCGVSGKNLVKLVFI